jgi:hypothetical protein
MGPKLSETYLDEGFPSLTDDGTRFWAPMSVRQNARSIDVPILMQMADEEYLGALESFQALRQNHKPAALYVFPDEHHVKWQPAHRLAAYTRSLDWFAYWLDGLKDPDPSKTTQYEAWDALKVEAALAKASKADAP